MNDIVVLLRTDDFVAVDKPAGLSVHNAEDAANLIRLLEKQLQLSKLLPVHRLDKETSGVQLFALKESSARLMAERFQQRAVKKTYQGVLRGVLPQKEGAWKQPLTDKAEGRKNPAGLAKDRVPCETRFRVLRENRYLTLCEFDLITGRQHQIRKHTALGAHPLVGDPRYGAPKYNAKMAALYRSDRMFLHCVRIELAPHEIESPLPADFQRLFDSSG